FAQQAKKDIVLEDIWARAAFRAKGVFGLNSMNDGQHYTAYDMTAGKEALVKYEYKSGKEVGRIFELAELKVEGKDKPLSPDEYSFSPDETKVLISTETEQIYRHSSREENYVLDLKTKKLTQLSHNGKQRYATFSPDGSKVAFVRENNIFLTDLATGKEEQITPDGEFNKIIYGGTDWVYEEEFAFDKAFFWSPDGKKIAFYRFDESAVKEFSMNEYGSALYPTEYRFKYPKAGEKNSDVSILMYDLATTKTISMNIGTEKDQYIPRIEWTADPRVLCIIRMNRLQNKMEMMLADANNGSTKTILTKTSNTFVDIHEDAGNFFHFLSDKKRFTLWIDDDGFNHIYLYDLNGNLINQVTKGNWDVMKFKGIDEKTNTLFYTSTESSPMERDLYSIRLDGSNKKKLSTRKGTNAPEFSEGMKYYINVQSDANTPAYVTINSADGKEIRVLEDNKDLKAKMEGYNLSKKEFFKFTTSEGIELNGWMIKPPNFDASKKYPVFMTVYGGPGINTVNDSWGGPDYFWHQLLAEKGYIVVSVDNRGTGGRGRDFLKCTYRQLGNLESKDQIEAAKYLGAQPYVDKSRIGIQGWSFGGYMSSLCITRGSDYFKAAIAVAPVTNWRYYDSIYTERYMGLPQDNASGYDDNSPINHVKELKGKYLLIHGTADDNVHFQNTVEMVAALVKINKPFDMFIYPDKNHSIAGGYTRMHLFTKMTNFLVENL
ncbi:MAG TPA: S9 family peptidase, partial [Bacteroidia bacterium]|nr:S9 family peptidase [Bacteroidia bacterium]